MSELESEASRQLIQNQFGKAAESYITSTVHAKGPSLNKLVDLLDPKPNWLVLDVATGAGHTAHAFAPFVKRIVAIDMTSKMMTVTAAETVKKRIENIKLVQADAENLPFSDDRFDALTCRIAAHHFSDLHRFMSEAARSIRQGGYLALVDNIVSGKTFGRKKDRYQREAGRFINAFEKLRDRSHVRCLSLDEWQEKFYSSGFQLIHHETIAKEMDFYEWTARMHVSEENSLRLQVMLHHAPQEVEEFLVPIFNRNSVTFTLTELLMIGKLINP